MPVRTIALTLAAAVLGAGWLTLAASPAPPALAQPAGGDLAWRAIQGAGSAGPVACAGGQQTAAGAPAPSPDPSLTAGVPAGIAFAPLAVAEAERLPPAPAQLQLVRLGLAPGAGAETRQATGPVLFYVETGTVTIYVTGVPASLAAGSSVLVPMDELYALANEGAAPASLLRLALAPRDAGDAPIANFLTPVPGPALSATAGPTGTLLFRADISAPPAGAARLFLACATWERPDAALGAYLHPGPVGLRVTTGSLVVDGTATLPETGCTFFPAGIPHRLQAGDPLPTVLYFGAIAGGQDLWLPVTDVLPAPAASEGEVSCGEA